MPKTQGSLWPEVVAWDNLYRSFFQARKGHRYNPEVLRFQDSLEENLTTVHHHLLNKTWLPGPWREFWIYDPKSRLIQAPPFDDRVVHHALVDVVEPYFEQKMIVDSYACRSGKGTHRAAARVQHHQRMAKLNWGKVYALKADISKYFPSINHEVMLAILARTIRDKDVLWLCEQLIRNSGYDARGIPVGALSSQLFANVYLDPFDHFVKDELGVRHYVRYMDDFVILGRSKEGLREVKARIEEYLAIELRLALNPKTTIFPTDSRMIDFAGYRICETHMLPRKRTIKRVKSSFRDLSKAYAAGEIDLEYVKPRLMSFLGYVQHCSAYRTTQSVLDELVLSRPGLSR